MILNSGREFKVAIFNYFALTLDAMSPINSQSRALANDMGAGYRWASAVCPDFQTILSGVAPAFARNPQHRCGRWPKSRGFGRADLTPRYHAYRNHDLSQRFIT
jgi:hypothetical protein